MAQNNIYDYTVSELILRLDSATSTSSYSPNIVITNSLNSVTVPENFNGPVTFTSEVTNIPSGYSVKVNTHVMTFPTGTTSVTNSSTVSTGTDTVIVGTIGSTYVLSVAMTLEHSTLADIDLTAVHTITSVLPIYYGVKPFEVTPDTTSLAEISSEENTFDLTATSVGRLNIVIPALNGAMMSVTDHSGLTIPASSFLLTTIGSLNHYVSTYDTQLTGTNVKTFTINYV